MFLTFSALSGRSIVRDSVMRNILLPLKQFFSCDSKFFTPFFVFLSFMYRERDYYGSTHSWRRLIKNENKLPNWLSFFYMLLHSLATLLYVHCYRCLLEQQQLDNVNRYSEYTMAVFVCMIKYTITKYKTVSNRPVICRLVPVVVWNLATGVLYI